MGSGALGLQESFQKMKKPQNPLKFCKHSAFKVEEKQGSNDSPIKDKFPTGGLPIVPRYKLPQQFPLPFQPFLSVSHGDSGTTFVAAPTSYIKV